MTETSSPRLAAVLISLLITGCATPHKVPAGTPTATYSLKAEIAGGSSTTRNIYTLINDSKCNAHPNGIKAGSTSKFGSPPVVQTESIQVMAEVPLYFTTNYIDSGFAINRACSLTGIFTPKTSHVYQARMLIAEDVTSCKLDLLDISSEQAVPVEFEMPEYVCTGEGGPKIKNGQPARLNWHFTVTPASK